MATRMKRAEVTKIRAKTAPKASKALRKIEAVLSWGSMAHSMAKAAPTATPLPPRSSSSLSPRPRSFGPGRSQPLNGPRTHGALAHRAPTHSVRIFQVLHKPLRPDFQGLSLCRYHERNGEVKMTTILA
jgi:hypothetical protein